MELDTDLPDGRCRGSAVIFAFIPEYAAPNESRTAPSFVNWRNASIGMQSFDLSGSCENRVARFNGNFWESAEGETQ
jgi:hypothetical protein